MKSIRLTFTLLVIALVGHTTIRAQDPLPSWNDGPAKQAIVDFVRVTTDQASPKFVPPEERIATFDQDGTLWVEPWTGKPINLAITRSLELHRSALN